MKFFAKLYYKFYSFVIQSIFITFRNYNFAIIKQDILHNANRIFEYIWNRERRRIYYEKLL